MKCIETLTIYANPDPLLVSRQAVFPGIVQLSDDTLVAMFSIGQAFDSADQRAFVSQSADFGRTWSAPVRLHAQNAQPFQLSESFKPLLLSDGTLLAAGYGFVRPDAMTPIVDPQTLDLLELRNQVSFSNDSGMSWTPPQDFVVEGAQLELSGPCIQLASGRILGAAAPFHLRETGHEGWIIFSDDGGKNWGRLSRFFKSEEGQISSWECRLCETAPPEIAVLFWAYDNKSKTNLTNRIVFSSDGGEHFGPAVDTGIMGQASNLLCTMPGEVLSIHAHREGDAGLWVRRVDISGGQFTVLEEINLFSGALMGSDSTNISKQFGSLKFGQPALLRMNNGEILATVWMVENCQHVIKGFVIEL